MKPRNDDDDYDDDNDNNADNDKTIIKRTMHSKCSEDTLAQTTGTNKCSN